ncbi:MMPL family transporter [Streptomyces sp. NPDC050564]|uniref:MMPL family transporter n=1 Tax=Streptomyces sp. NPDC050564 TaxID=3365631 RepID=UPI0037B03F59
MTSTGRVAAPRAAKESAAPGGSPPGLLGRLGLWSAAHLRLVAVIWLALVAGLGALAPSATSALAGAGWQADGSDSVAVRELAQKHFGGNSSAALQVVVKADRPVSDSVVQDVVGEATALLKADPDISEVVAPQPGSTISHDGRTAIILGGAGAGANEMVKAAEALKGPLTALSADGIQVSATGSSMMWSDFNTASHDAMMKSEMLSWPVTLGILVLAFGTLVAAGLPLLLTVAGLAASAGTLVLLDHVTPVSIWAMNFAMMFALALGIDYALFLVVRFRAALARHGDARRAVGETMDTAGKAVLLSGVTVVASLGVVLLVPSPAFRTMALGIMLAVAFVLAATLTLLPAVLGKLGVKVNSGALPWRRGRTEPVGGSPRFGSWGERLWAHPLRHGIPALVVLVALAVPIVGLKVAMPSIDVVPDDSSSHTGYTAVQKAFGDGAAGTLQIIAPAAEAEATAAVLKESAGIAAVMPARSAADDCGLVLIQAVPTVDPSDAALSTTVDRLRADLPDRALVGGAAVENLDLQSVLDEKTPIVIGAVLALGFLLLLFALQAPLVALLGTVTNLLATGAAFGAARLIFQEGHGASLLDFTPQGFMDGWGPVFFFAMIFAIAMDYTVFLLSSAKEQYEQTGDPRKAMVGALAHSGRVIFAAAAVMVAVFFTFALSGPLPPKEMGIILGLAVLLDAALVRLVLLPVLLRLTGRAAWWSPAWLHKVLPDIKFSHD